MAIDFADFVAPPKVITNKVGGIGAHGARETPVPIPNTAVKPSSGYNTWV